MKAEKKQNWLISSIISAVLFYAALKGFQSNPETYLWPFLSLMGAALFLGDACGKHSKNKKIEG